MRQAQRGATPSRHTAAASRAAAASSAAATAPATTAAGKAAIAATGPPAHVQLTRSSGRGSAELAFAPHVTVHSAAARLHASAAAAASHAATSPRSAVCHASTVTLSTNPSQGQVRFAAAAIATGSLLGEAVTVEVDEALAVRLSEALAVPLGDALSDREAVALPLPLLAPLLLAVAVALFEIVSDAVMGGAGAVAVREKVRLAEGVVGNEKMPLRVGVLDDVAVDVALAEPLCEALSERADAEPVALLLPLLAPLLLAAAVALFELVGDAVAGEAGALAVREKVGAAVNEYETLLAGVLDAAAVGEGWPLDEAVVVRLAEGVAVRERLAKTNAACTRVAPRAASPRHEDVAVNEGDGDTAVTLLLSGA